MLFSQPSSLINYCLITSYSPLYLTANVYLVHCKPLKFVTSQGCLVHKYYYNALSFKPIRSPLLINRKVDSYVSAHDLRFMPTHFLVR